MISDDAATADALSTALFVKGKDAALDFYKAGVYDFEAVIQTKDGELYITDGLKADDRFELYVKTSESTGE